MKKYAIKSIFKFKILALVMSILTAFSFVVPCSDNTSTVYAVERNPHMVSKDVKKSGIVDYVKSLNKKVVGGIAASLLFLGSITAWPFSGNKNSLESKNTNIVTEPEPEPPAKITVILDLKKALPSEDIKCSPENTVAKKSSLTLENSVPVLYIAEIIYLCSQIKSDDANLKVLIFSLLTEKKEIVWEDEYIRLKEKVFPSLIELFNLERKRINDENKVNNVHENVKIWYKKQPRTLPGQNMEQLNESVSKIIESKYTNVPKTFLVEFQHQKTIITILCNTIIHEIIELVKIKCS